MVSARRSRQSARRRRASPRWMAGCALQAFWALAARSTTATTSAGEAAGISAKTLPVAGFITPIFMSNPRPAGALDIRIERLHAGKEMIGAPEAGRRQAQQGQLQ